MACEVVAVRGNQTGLWKLAQTGMAALAKRSRFGNDVSVYWLLSI